VGLDLGAIRDFDYYTGVISKATVRTGPAVAQGGRYDRLLERFRPAGAGDRVRGPARPRVELLARGGRAPLPRIDAALA